MIVFDVKCGKDHVFEGWFRSSDDFRAQAEAGEIACPVCGDNRVEKALMAPHVATGAGGRREEKAADGGDKGEDAVAGGRGEDTAAGGERSVTLAKQKEKTGRAMAMMRAVKAHVERHFDNVGAGFAEEARKIHYGESDKRNIYGQATRDQARQLRDEGIEFGQLPDVPKLDG